MVKGGGCNIGGEICVADFVSGVHALGRELVQFHINRHRAAKLPPPRAVIKLAVLQIGGGFFGRCAFTQNMQPHCRFQMVPRVNDPALEPWN